MQFSCLNMNYINNNWIFMFLIKKHVMWMAGLWTCSIFDLINRFCEKHYREHYNEHRLLIYETKNLHNCPKQGEETLSLRKPRPRPLCSQNRQHENNIRTYKMTK